jgi:hypothetical protein
MSGFEEYLSLFYQDYVSNDFMDDQEESFSTYYPFSTFGRTNKRVELTLENLQIHNQEKHISNRYDNSASNCIEFEPLTNLEIILLLKKNILKQSVNFWRKLKERLALRKYNKWALAMNKIKVQKIKKYNKQYKEKTLKSIKNTKMHKQMKKQNNQEADLDDILQQAINELQSATTQSKKTNISKIKNSIKTTVSKLVSKSQKNSKNSFETFSISCNQHLLVKDFFLSLSSRSRQFKRQQKNILNDIKTIPFINDNNKYKNDKEHDNNTLVLLNISHPSSQPSLAPHLERFDWIEV